MSHGAWHLAAVQRTLRGITVWWPEAQALESGKPGIESCYTFCSLCDRNQASRNNPEPQSSSVTRTSQRTQPSPG